MLVNKEHLAVTPSNPARLCKFQMMRRTGARGSRYENSMGVLQAGTGHLFLYTEGIYNQGCFVKPLVAIVCKTRTEVSIATIP